MKKDDESKINSEDIRWMELVLRTIDGLAAQAEMQDEACDPEWMAMQYGLESARDILKEQINDFKQRIKNER